MQRLRWNGNLEACRQHEVASKKLRNRKKKRSTKKQRRQRAKRQQQRKPRYVADYHKYLRSRWWRRRRLTAIADAGNKCESCGGTVGLHVHHIHYTRLYCEKKTDLKVLCQTCHELAHAMDLAAREHLSRIMQERTP